MLPQQKPWRRGGLRTGTALAQSDCARAAALIHADGHWRDVLAFTWHLKTFNGVEQITSALQSTLSATHPTGFRLSTDRTPPRHVVRAGVDAVEAIFSFETGVGRGSGVVRLVPDETVPGGMCAWALRA